MKRLNRIFIESLGVLCLLEMLAAYTNTDIDADALLQQGYSKTSASSEDILGEQSATRTHKPNAKAIADGASYYRVVAGDTLYSIAGRAGDDVNSLAKRNGIAAPYKIQVGQKVKLLHSFAVYERPLQFAATSSKTVPKVSDSVRKTRISSQKKLTLSNDNRKVLKFYCEWPVRGKILKSFSQSGNKGIDIATEFGRSVKAAASGKVVYSGQGLLGYGKLLIIKHNEGFLTAYGNNSKLLVREGQRVESGRIIAEAGKGPGNKAVLHFEIRKNGEPVNPIEYLPKEK
jgi:lipoprotein NlpD